MHLTKHCKVRSKPDEPTLDKENADLLLCKLIVNNSLSLRLSDCPEMRALLSYHTPGYKPPGRVSVGQRTVGKNGSICGGDDEEAEDDRLHMPHVRRLDKRRCAKVLSASSAPASPFLGTIVVYLVDSVDRSGNSRIRRRQSDRSARRIGFQVSIKW